MNPLDKQYTALLQDILDTGVKKETRNGGTLSVFGRQIRHKMSDGFPLLTTKKMYWNGIVTELLWFLRGDTNIKYLVDNNCHIWDGDAYKNYSDHFIGYEDVPTKEWFINEIKNNTAFAKRWGDLGPIYGRQWRDWEIDDTDLGDGHKMYIDQIANLINDLKTNPDSRRLMVSAWNVGELDQMVLPPCHYGFQVYTRELSLNERDTIFSERTFISTKGSFAEQNGTLADYLDKEGIPRRAISLMWNQRSCDVPLGIPFNIASYGLLLEIIATTTNMIPDELIGNLGDCHIYLNQVDGVKEQIGREPYPLPTININTEWWPTESGECGIGAIDAVAVFNNFTDDNFCRCLLEEDIQLANYQSHPSIKAPLSN